MPSSHSASSSKAAIATTSSVSSTSWAIATSMVHTVPSGRIGRAMRIAPMMRPTTWMNRK